MVVDSIEAANEVTGTEENKEDEAQVTTLAQDLLQCMNDYKAALESVHAQLDSLRAEVQKIPVRIVSPVEPSTPQVQEQEEYKPLNKLDFRM